MKEYECKVLEIERFDGKNKASYMVIRIEKPKEFGFRAGQYVMLGSPKLRDKKNPKSLLYRAYSVASSPQMPFLEFVIAVCYRGGLTQFLSENLKLGDILSIKGPHGKFTVREDSKRIVFIVTGASVAPAISMVRDLFHKKTTKAIQFFYGFNSCSLFIYQEELEGYARNKNFHLYPTSLEEGPCCWKGKCGYIQPIVEEEAFRDENTHFYVCGGPASLKATFAALKKMNVPTERIFTEVSGK